MMSSTELPWVVFRLQSEYFALPIENLEEMVRLGEVSALPGAPAFVCGLITLRGRAIPVTDLRLRLGMSSTVAERDSLLDMLAAREQDHRDWLVELENSVREKRPFKLAVDPHKCAFGRWYDSFHTEDISLGAMLRRFNAPHQTIHGIARSVTDLAARERFDEAFALIERTRSAELNTMIKLFELTRQMIRETRREVGLILRLDGRLHALAVDAVDSVAPLRMEEDVNGVLTTELQRVIDRIARWSREQQVVMVLRPAEIVSGAAAAPA